MPLAERRRRQLTGAGLVIATLATRLPFATTMLAEFDSVNFAVGTVRYSLEQVTPHFPGYILHILFAKLLLLFTSDTNQAFVWISILLSIGSVLYLWRAAAVLRGERVGLIAASIWLVLPIFWYYGLVATAYEYEAFFASALLYHGLRLMRSHTNRVHFFALVILLSLAGAARQSSLLLFFPAVMYAALVTRQSAGRILQAIGVFVLVTGVWVSALFAYCGGVLVYLHAMSAESIYRSQSFLFGNSFTEHLAIMAKCLVYLGASCFPLILVTLYAAIKYPKRLRAFMIEAREHESFRMVTIVAVPALAFYLFIYFMKGGYLLTLMPSIVLAGAVLIDQLSIWHAYDIKTAPGNALLLTRPIITRRVLILTFLVAAVSIAWFVTPFPGNDQASFDRAFAHDAFGARRSSLPKQPGALRYALDRVLAFTSLQSAREGDVLHSTMLRTLRDEARKGEITILDTWWHRWEYYYLPGSFSYDIRDYGGRDTIAVGRSIGYLRTMDLPQVMILPSTSSVLLVIPREHPAFADLAAQVHLERLPISDGLDIWRITDSSFHLNWKNRVFVKR
ncbi:MAG: glycosyltransferase family 39 protein [Bacteroidetes bacterium]|nr:glycosyltransferase family 39 protein [Bacteroidota bacterium]